MPTSIVQNRGPILLRRTGTGPQPDDYLPRYLDDELKELLPELPAVAIDGPKGVGKTATATRYADDVLQLDYPDVRALIEADPINQLQRSPSMCIDEWQNAPAVWDYVRRLVDGKADTKFLLTGSASPIHHVNTHSGAGRIISLRMRPLSLAERPGTEPAVTIEQLFSPGSTVQGSTDFSLSDYAKAICQTGLPAFMDLSPRVRLSALEGYAQRIIDRDLPELGASVRRPEALRSWMTAYSAATSTTTMYSTILDAATPNDADKPARDTTQTYRDLLTKIWILDPVPAWTPSMTPLKRLTNSAKHQLVDPGLAAHLLGASEATLLSGGPGTAELFGQLFEALATLTVRAAGQAAGAQTYHVRTRGGQQEIDLLLERYDTSVIGFEMKLTRVVTDAHVKHLHWLKAQIGQRMTDMVVIYTGAHAYRRTDGVAVIPLALLG